jgi:hypothetical protein
MRANMVFALVICYVFLPWVPLEGVHLLRYFIPNPEKSHFHSLQMLLFNGVVRDANRSCIIAMYRVFWLQVTHIIEGESKNNSRLAIVV